MYPKDTEGIAEAIWSGPALFAQTCLSENLNYYGKMTVFAEEITRTCWNSSLLWRPCSYIHRLLELQWNMFDETPESRLKQQPNKFPKYSDTQKMCCNHSKIWTMSLYHRVMSPNDTDGMANRVDPDQTAPLGAVWARSTLFAQAYLSENLGSLRYNSFPWPS